MKRLLKINAVCIAISIFINVFPNMVGAEHSLWENMNSSEIFDVKNYDTLIEENAYENDYTKPYIQLLVRYIDSEGEKVDNGTFVSSFFDTIQVDSDIDIDSYIDTLKSDNDNISYIQKDHELILSATDDEKDFDTNNINIEDQTEKEENLQIENVSIEDDINRHSDDIIIAVIDSGIDIEHEALKDNIFVNKGETKDDSDTDNNGYVDDISGWDFVNDAPLSYEHTQIVEYSHGTHVAGIIAGNSNEIQGVHSTSKILPLKVFENGSGYTSDVIKAVEYAQKMGTSIVNCSFGSDDENKALEETIKNSNMVFVCASGNDARNLDEYPVYPSSYDFDNVISVSATDNNGEIAYFSNYGNNVDIATNGLSIKSSVPENEYGNSSGTSSATAYISGVISDIIKENADSSWIDTAKHFIDSIEDTTIVEETDTHSKKEDKQGISNSLQSSVYCSYDIPYCSAFEILRRGSNKRPYFGHFIIPSAKRVFQVRHYPIIAQMFSPPNANTNRQAVCSLQLASKL